MNQAVTLPNGTVLTGEKAAQYAMTPEERHNAVAKSMGLPTVAKPDGRQGFGPPLHVHPTGGGLVDTTAAASKAPPSPQQLEAQNKPAANVGEHDPAKLAAFDAEMRARGLQVTPGTQQPQGERLVIGPDGQRHLAANVDSEAIELLSARYKATVAHMPEEQRARFTATFHKDLAEIYNGKVLTAAQKDKLRLSGNVDSFLPKEKPAAQTAVSEHTPQAWAEAHVSVADKEGWVPLERINVSGLSGYTLPKFLPDQTYHVSIFQDLANARKQGISQKQVEGFIRAGMVQNGLLKS